MYLCRRNETGKKVIEMREGAEFRELMLQIVRTRMAFRRSMQRTLRKITRELRLRCFRY